MAAPPDDAARTKILNLRVTEHELAKAHELARSEGLTVSGLLRQFIIREHRARFADDVSGKRKKGGR